jgi:uncharacterized coiled-coil protein SlyX
MDGAGSTTYMVYDSTSVNIYNSGKKGFALTNTGGTLHGVWSADVSLTLSDRRLKTDITPIDGVLSSRAHELGAGDEDASQWLLRELRPVSFRLKTGSESKFVKFGFIAQDLERLFPDMVREDPTSGVRQVVYNDLFAILTGVAQAQEARLKALEVKVAEQAKIIQELQGSSVLVAELQASVRELNARMAAVERQSPSAR